MMLGHTIEISDLKDIGRAETSVGLPVGPRTGTNKRTKQKKEWFVVLKFLKSAIPAGIFQLPISIRNGHPPEPDFVVTKNGTTEVACLIEITEASNEADQREATLSELSGERATILGQFGGRFADGASRPGLIWASDIVDAIKRKGGKAIFKDSPASRHLIVYPNSNASFLLFDVEDETEAVGDLRSAIANEQKKIEKIINGCSIHILGKNLICIDATKEMKILPTKLSNRSEN